jgi:uncharacterized membrane protein (DUF2068 family)
MAKGGVSGSAQQLDILIRRRACTGRGDGYGCAVSDTTPQPTSRPEGHPDRAGQRPLPGTVKPKRFRPKLHYELLVCGVSGHELVGTDAAELRPQDHVLAVDADGVRWHRCLRCDSWLPLPRPESPTSAVLPGRDELELPLRGRPLRDKIVLRAIAIDRGLHFVVLALLGLAILLFASKQTQLRDTFYRVAADLSGGPIQKDKVGVLGELNKLFSLKSSTLNLVGFGVIGYAVLEGVEAVGLWWQKRWAEYLTLIATALFIPLEVYEIVHKGSPLKILALIVNVAVVLYLLFAKRLFGIRGGAAAEHAQRERDSGWEALERATPWLAHPEPAALPSARGG